MNDGGGKFEFRPLPRVAQISPGFGASLVDVDADGNLDLFITQNFYGPQRETGHMDGGVGMLLLGSDKGSWEPVWPNTSGLVVPQDGMSLVRTDFNDDGNPDFLIGQNNGTFLAYTSKASKRNMRPMRRRVVVQLRGMVGNVNAIGARVELVGTSNPQVQEVTSTSGYLSQKLAAFAVYRS